MYSLGAINVENGGGAPSPVESETAPEPQALPTSEALIHPVLAPEGGTVTYPEGWFDPGLEPVPVEAAPGVVVVPTDADPLGIYDPELDPDADNPLIHPVRVVEVRQAPAAAGVAGAPSGALGWLLLLGLAGALMMGSDV